MQDLIAVFFPQSVTANLVATRVTGKCHTPNPIPIDGTINVREQRENCNVVFKHYLSFF